MNLTAIKNATEGAELRDHEDDAQGVKGLQLRVRGGNKAFFLYYRNATGQRRRPKIGDFPAITLQTAREIAREWLGEVARGKDPSGERATLRASETVSSLCDRYLAETEGRASYRHDKGRVENTLKPEWGTKRIPEVSKADVIALRRKMRKKPVAYNRVAALISQLWKFADMPSPAEGVERYTEIPRDRYLDQEEYDRLVEALDETEAQYPHAVALIRLLLLTGARFSEIAKSKRSQYRDGVLHLPKHKTAKKVGAREIVFSAEARAVVENIDPRGGWLVGFSSGPWAAWQLVKARAELEDFKLHDLRHSFASDAMKAGYGLDVIGKSLGHADVATTGRYAHLAKEKQLEVAEAVAAARLNRPNPREQDEG